MQLLLWISVGVVPAAVAIVAFVPRELWKRRRGPIVDRLEVSLLRGFSRFAGRYREFVLSKQRHVDLKGLATVGFYNPELAEVYVDVSLAYRAPHEIPASVVARIPTSVTDRHSIDEFLDHATPIVLAVIGAAGSGKTTLLRHTANTISRSRRRRRPVPILLYLRDHVAALANADAATLPDLVRATLGRYAAYEPPGWFEQRLADGDCVVLLDGLDEVAVAEERRRISDWVEKSIQQYPHNDWIISSRPDGYRTAPVNGALVVQVRGFTDEQVASFLDGWFVAVEKKRGGAGEDTTRSARLQAQELLEKLEQSPNLRDLAVNPLLLTMIANVHLYRGALPGSRADLYREICEVLLWRRGEIKGLVGSLAGDKKTILLNSLAFAMMQHRVRDLPRAEMIAELETSLSRMSTSMTAEEFLQEVQSHGIIVERESDQFAFAHLTFQESLAAAHIRSKGLGDVLVAGVNDSWWRETTLLYVAQSDADRIVRACLDTGAVAAWSLAFDCAAETGDLSRELRDELDVLLDTEHEDPDRQRLRIGVQATRYLNDQMRISTGERICARPVPQRLYHLFCSETGWRHRPDCVPVDGNRAVRGIRGSDAQAFVEWIAGVAGGQRGCVLPTEDQLAQLPWGGSDNPDWSCCVWTDGPALWVPDAVTPANRIQRHQLEEVLARDCEFLRPLLDRALVVELSRELTDYIPAVKVKPVRTEMIEASLHYRNTRYTALDAVRRIAEKSEEPISAAVEVLTLDRFVQLDIEPLAVLVCELDKEIRAASSAGSEYASAMTKPARSRMMERRYDAVRAAWRLRAVVENFPETRFLSNALSAAIGAPEGEWPDRIANALCETIPLRTYERPVDFDDVVELLSDGGLSYDPRLSRAVAGRVERLIEKALPVFERRTELTRSLASGIRLAAVCLANDVIDRRQQHDLRYLACATTVLEMRMLGELSPNETMLLAVI